MKDIRQISRRDPGQVMRLHRMGSFHQCRLSFMRQLTRRWAAEGWQCTRADWQVDAQGVGHAVYTVDTGARRYSLVAFAHDLPAEKRSDRVIAEAWDATFALFDGVPTGEDIARLSQNVPVQEAGRVSERELTLSRANRSVRLWAHVVEALRAGHQPDPAQVAEVGYLMRTTAVYGSGKFGAADRDMIADRPEMQAPFQAEMLTVYLIRTFVRDLLQHMAGPGAARLDDGIARSLGIGNSTGLGMAPFLINHPVLLNNWIMAREEALARVRGLETVSVAERRIFDRVLEGAQATVAGWHSAHPLQQARLADLRADLAALTTHLEDFDWESHAPWDAFFGWAEDALSPEGQELLVSLMMEPYGDLIDGLAECMADPFDGQVRLKGSMPVGELVALLEDCFGWASGIDWGAPDAQARAWYVSAEKLEPRLGERHAEPIAPYEQPLAPAREAAAALADLRGLDAEMTLAEALELFPQHRGAALRAQISAFAPYAEIRDNTIDAAMLPIDMLRAKLSFFGATRFDPRSDRWVRITMFAGAPYPEDLNAQTADFWAYP